VNRIFPSAAALAVLAVCQAQAQALPPAASDRFCVEAQKFLSRTGRESSNTVFTDMPAYRASKPMVDPLTNYQVVSYRSSVSARN